jgi:hypothetical protein
MNPTPAQKRQWQADHPVQGEVFTGGYRKPPKDRVYPDWWRWPEGKSRNGIQYACPHEPCCTESGWTNWACGLRQLQEQEG